MILLEKKWGALALSCFLYSATAQKTAIDSVQPEKVIAPVPILAARLTLTDVRAPLAVTVLDNKRLQTGTQQLSLYEVLGGVPGLFALNADNFSQDLRLSIRGFGARSAFGIRGIRLFTDGLPEGTPDGQADVDNLDMGLLRQVEVLRGTASAMYGNAAGGVILMRTENPTSEKPVLEAQTTVGSFGFQRYQIKIGQKLGRWAYLVNGSHLQNKGYRQWSAVQNSLFNAKISYQIKPQTQITVLANYGDSPLANDPGGLTLAQTQANRQQAGANNLSYQTGERVAQGRIGVTFETAWRNKHSLQGRLFYTNRHLENRLAIFSNGYGDLSRSYGGGSLSYQWTTTLNGQPYRLKIGFDIENQVDIRKRFGYKTDTVQGKAVFSPDKLAAHQRETFDSRAVFILQDWQPWPQCLVSVGGRFDQLSLYAKDFYLTDGDQSGRRGFSQFNPHVGINYTLTAFLNAYGSFSATFETPTLNELSNNPYNTGGFNPDLLPQKAQSFEMGLKGRLQRWGRWDLAAYYIKTQNDLVPYQLPQQAGKVFYRNAGTTSRLGAEMSLTAQIVEGWAVFWAHTIGLFKYDTYTANGVDFSGKKLPGIPPQYGQLESRYEHEKGFFSLVQYRYAAAIQVNDANTNTAPAYSVVNMRLGQRWSRGKVGLEGFMGINNLLNAHYMSNVLLNATAERFYEPATPRHYFIGLKCRLGA